MKKVAIFFLLFYVVSILNAFNKSKISVFYKEMKPSQQVLTRVDSLLNNFLDSYNVQYYNIEDTENISIIKKLGLPDTHFPFAIVIDGKFTTNILGKTISFIHFPLFMKGIGRHEGNWSLEELQQVLESNNLLADENILPILDEEIEDIECED
jgi:hypothetical protein